MHVLTTEEMNHVNGAAYTELLLLTTATMVGFLGYQTWWSLHHQLPDTPPHQEAYYDGAMLYLSNGAHCS